MRKRRKTVTVTFDGVEYEAYADESVMDASRRLGVEIPSLCYLEGLSVWGGCRMCVVQVAEDHRLRPACATPVAPDMEIHTNTPQIKAHRKTITELLFAEGNHVCAVCVVNGNCELQDVAVVNEMDHVRFDYQSPLREIDASHPKYIFDPNRCILCTRCVRVCDEVEGAHTWDVMGRGIDCQVVTDLNRPWGESPSCTECGKCVQVCPTGALVKHGMSAGEMHKDQHFLPYLSQMRGGQ